MELADSTRGHFPYESLQKGLLRVVKKSPVRKIGEVIQHPLTTYFLLMLAGMGPEALRTVVLLVSHLLIGEKFAAKTQTLYRVSQAS